MTARNNRNRLSEAPITPIVAPMWLGCERRGADLGAAALHQALREVWRPDRVGDRQYARLSTAIEIDCPVPDAADRLIDHRALDFREPILDSARSVADAVHTAIDAGALALTIGGDHALAFGTLTGAVRANDRLGLIWLDTHPDLNTPATSTSGHMHGMPLGTAIGLDDRALPELQALAGGRTLNPANVAMLGIRDIDPAERDTIARHGIWALTMEEWTDTGIVAGLGRALDHLAARGVTAVHVSFDLDVIDPSVLPGTGTKAPGGLTYREASQVVRRLGAWDGPIHSFDMVELNPRLDPGGASTRIAALLLATTLGMRQLPPRD
jgi:arginase